jgi:hypothetical protein
MPIKMAVVNMHASLIWKSEPPAAAHMDNLGKAAVVPADQKMGAFYPSPPVLRCGMTRPTDRSRFAE